MAHDAQKISREQAARAFSACAGLDPCGVETPDSAAMRGQCFRISAEHGNLIYSAAIEGGVFWCIAAAGTGHGMTAAGLQTMEQQARDFGCHAIGFQTLRRGLARAAGKRGYNIAAHDSGRGFTLNKALL